jgi:hypothetical protein
VSVLRAAKRLEEGRRMMGVTSFHYRRIAMLWRNDECPHLQAYEERLQISPNLVVEIDGLILRMREFIGKNARVIRKLPAMEAFHSLFTFREAVCMGITQSERIHRIDLWHRKRLAEAREERKEKAAGKKAVVMVGTEIA